MIKDTMDFFNEMMANKFDCLLIEREQEDNKVFRSIVYYTRKITVDYNENNEETGRHFEVERHVLKNSKTDDELDIWDLYRSLIEIVIDHGFTIVEHVKPCIVVNNLAVERDENGKHMVYTVKGRKIITKSNRGRNKQETLVDPNLTLSDQKSVFYVFKDGLTLEHSPNQPTRIGAFLFDKAPTPEQNRKTQEAIAIREQAERDERKYRIAKIYHEILKREKAKKNKEQAASTKEATKRAKEIVEDQEKEA